MMELDDSPLASRSRFSTTNDVKRALVPFQESADRVGRQVEQFAEAIDRFDPLHDEKTGVAAALPLIEEFEKIAGETVKRLKRRHGDERRQLLKQSRRRLNAQKPGALIHKPDDGEAEMKTGTTVQDLVHWEQERQTWELLKLVLQVKDEDVASSERPAKLPVHRYSSDAAVYNTFLATDDEAWEKHVLLQWLSRAADSAEEDVYELVEDEIAAQGLGEATNAQGWVRAKETIKQQKRLRSWGRPLDPSSKEVATLFAGDSRSGDLITQLDPDAPTRQGRNLPDEDIAFERAVWMGCWELLKRGRPWADILEWCKDSAETWRALSLRPNPTLQPEEGTASGSNLRGRAYWQQTCLQLALSGGVDDYERAIYGLFGGDDKSVFRVCRTWNDHLYGLLSCQLAQKYNLFFCQQFNLPPALSSDDISGSLRTSLQHFVEQLATRKELKDEVKSPFTMLQSSIMTGQITQFISEQGAQLTSHLGKAHYGSFGHDRIPEFEPPVKRATSPLTPNDHDIIRILAHLAIVYSSLDPSLAKNTAANNIIVSYVDYLGKAGKQQLLPIYASRLSKDRAAVCLARQLIYIKDPTERQTIVRLMEQFGMESEVILFAQVDVIVADAPGKAHSKGRFPPLQILIKNPEKEVPDIKRDFMGEVIQEWERDMIDALEWFLLIDGHWEETFTAGTIAYKHFLRTQSWAAARELAHKISFSRISRMKTRKLLGKEVDLSEVLLNGDSNYDHKHLDDSDEMNQDGEATGMKQLTAQAQRDQLLKNSRTFQDLENFVLALDALDQWEQMFHMGERVRQQAREGDKSALKDWKKDFQAAHDAVGEAIQPLLRGWLMSPKDDDEADETRQIRKRVLPEIILAYLSIHNDAGHYLHREALLECMNIARLIADPESGADLCEVFVESGRMAELASLLAILSQNILQAEEHAGKTRMSQKRRGDGESLDIWSIGGEAVEGQQLQLEQQQ